MSRCNLMSCFEFFQSLGRRKIMISGKIVKKNKNVNACKNLKNVYILMKLYKIAQFYDPYMKNKSISKHFRTPTKNSNFSGICYYLAQKIPDWDLMYPFQSSMIFQNLVNAFHRYMNKFCGLHCSRDKKFSIFALKIWKVTYLCRHDDVFDDKNSSLTDFKTLC